MLGFISLYFDITNNTMRLYITFLARDSVVAICTITIMDLISKCKST